MTKVDPNVLEQVKKDLKQLRRMSKVKIKCLQSTALTSPELDYVADYYKLKNKYLELIENLDIIDKYIINSAYIKGMSYITIAQKINYSEICVKKRACKAINTIALYYKNK